MSSPTHYELLGVAPSATTEEIRTAYRRLMRTAHPDVGGTAALFRLIQNAHDVLTDPQRRAAYDATLPGGAGFGSASSSAASSRSASGTASSGPSAASGAGASTASGSEAPRPQWSANFPPMERPPRAQQAQIGAIFDPPLFGAETTRETRRRGFGSRGSRRQGPREPQVATDILPMSTLRTRTIGTMANPTSPERLRNQEAVRRTAEILELSVMPAFPAMRLLNGLREPGSAREELDNVVLVGDRVIVIDSVFADSLPVPTELPSILGQLMLWFDPWRVTGLVVAHSTSGRLDQPRLTPPAGDGPMGDIRYVNPRQLIDVVHEAAVLEPRTHVVNVRLLKRAVSLRPDGGR